jgi:RNA polymerase-interacting CarD/CdnL/TRCF family regulator
LLPEEAGQFDIEWQAAMTRSADSLDLTDVYRVLQRWHSIAEITRSDPRAHRRMLRRADRILAGEARGGITADDQRAMIARRLGGRP